MHIKADSGATIQAIDAARFCTIRNRNIAEAKGVKFINGSYWEDICCKSGPLVNPTFFREACAPQYRRHSELLNKHGVNLLTEARLVPPAAER